MQASPIDVDQSINSLWMILIPALAIIALLGIAFIFFMLRLFRRDSKKPTNPHENITIDISALSPNGPLGDGPNLTVYGVPVRLAVFVLAPLGRSNEIPPPGKLENTVDQLVPGLMEVLSLHQPIFRRWPPQLSWHGFTQSFFSNMALPGDHGKTTPWCSVTGKFESNEGHFLAGLICCADQPNSLSQIVVDQEGKWLDIIRVQK